MNIKRIVPHDDPVIQSNYKQIIDRFPDCVVVEDEHGTYRFRQNGVVCYLFDTKQLDLNKMARDYHRGLFSADDYAIFYMNLGYSLSGWLDVFIDKLWPAEE